MLTRVWAAIAGTALVLSAGIAVAAPASAADGTYCDVNGQCYLTISAPPSDPPSHPDASGWTAGAPTCYWETSESGALQLGYKPEDMRVFDEGTLQQYYVIIKCGSDTSYWSNTRQCYVYLKDGPWPGRPAGYSPNASYYGCIMFQPGGGGVAGIDSETTFWSETVPPGLKVLTPGAAAKQLVDSFQLRGIDIGMAPEVNPAWGHRRSYVGIPVWLWVNNPQPLTWGPYTQTATLGGQTITATARVTGIRWNMGDGHEVVCGSTGTAYSIGYGLTDSPTCGYRYGHTSTSQPGDRFTVTATSQWTVTWTSAGGASGTINLNLANSTQLEVNEIQSVNVTPTTPNG